MSTTLERASKLSKQRKLPHSRHVELVVTERNKQIIALKKELRAAHDLIRAYERSSEADQRDAARYRWLRDMWPLEIGLLLGYEAGRNPDVELDAAIDAAMQQSGQSGQSAPESEARRSGDSQ